MTSLVVRDQFRHIELEGVADPSSQSLLLQVTVLCNLLYKLGQLHFHLIIKVLPLLCFFCCFDCKNSCNFQPELFKISLHPLISPFEDGHFSIGAQGVMTTNSWVLWRARANKKKVALVACVISAEVTFFHCTRRESYYQLTYCVTRKQESPVGKLPLFGNFHVEAL